MKRLRHARLRVRLTAVSALLSLIIVGGSLVALIGVLQQEAGQTIAARLEERATALAATVDGRRGQVDVHEADQGPSDGTSWIYDASGAQLAGPTSNGPLAARLASLSTTRTARTATAGPWHLRAVPVTDDGGGRGGGGGRGDSSSSSSQTIAVVITGIDDRPYAETLGSTVRAAVLLGLLAVIGATALAALVLARSLGPIATMTDQAAGWSRTRSEGRFALGPPKDEIGRLAAVLDDLLDRVDAALQAERRLTAEIAHELRTPLTLLTGEAQLALMSTRLPDDLRPRFERIQLAADTMARAITTLLADAAASAERDTGGQAEPAVRAVMGTLDFAGTIEVTGTCPPLSVPSATLERMLAPLLDNAARLATSRIEVSLTADTDTAAIRIADDGSGVDRAVQDSLFTPGVSARAGGTGIGLALARRLARDAGGDVVLVAARPAVFELRLPLAEPAVLLRGRTSPVN